MKKLIIILINLSITQFSFAQTGIMKGQVYDKDEKVGFISAKVVLINQNIETYTDENGKFILDSIPIGKHDLKVSFPLSRDLVLSSINVTKDTVINLFINYPPPYSYTFKNKTCPICKKQNRVIPIVYGYPGKNL